MAEKKYAFTVQQVRIMANLVMNSPMPSIDEDDGKAWKKMVHLQAVLDAARKEANETQEKMVTMRLWGWGAKTLANMLKTPVGVNQGGQAVLLSWPAALATEIAAMLTILTGETVGDWADMEDDEDMTPLKGT